MGLKIRASGHASPLWDADEVRKAVTVFFDPIRQHMLQVLPQAVWSVVGGSDVPKVIAEAERLSFGSGTYFTINPARPGAYDHCLTDPDIDRRRWILIDLDRDVPKSEKSRNATDAEKAAVNDTAFEIDVWMQSQGFPCQVFVDSGNGFHMYFRVDLPNDPEARTLVKAFLDALAARFDVAGKAKIDTSCHDARRIARLPGTWARKGPNEDDRPQRPCRFVLVPDEVHVVPRELIAESIRSLLADVPAVPVPKADHADYRPIRDDLGPFILKRWGDEDNAKRWAKAGLERECAKIRATSSYRNNALVKASFALGGLVGIGLLDEQDVAFRLGDAARACGLFDDPNDGERKTMSTIRRGIEAGKAEPRQYPNLVNGMKPAPARPASPPPSLNGKHDEPKKVDRIIRWGDTIEPVQAEWLWESRINIGKTTVFAGKGGLGKTFVLCDLASRVTIGAEWPFSGGEQAPQGKVLFISGEDDPEDTLVPRMIGCGADMRQVMFFCSEALAKFSFRDSDQDMLNRSIAEALAEVDRPGMVKLVVIDPPSSFLDGVDENSNAELRGVLAPLGRWASRNRAAIIFNSHVNKGSGAKSIDAAARVIGSVAWVNSARSAHMFAKDPDDPSKRLFCPIKINLGPEKKGLAYRLQPIEDSWMARVEWIGEVDVSADDAVDERSRRNESVGDRLIRLFNEKPRWRLDELVVAVKGAIGSKGEKALQDKLKDLGIDSRRDGFQGKHYWEAPTNWVHRIRTQEGDEE